MPHPWLDQRNWFKQALRDGRLPVGMWITTPWEGALRILGDAGADAAFIDLEHVSYELETAQRLIIAAEGARISPIVRPAHVDPSVVSRLLDAGAHGIVFPHVESCSDAEAAVASLRYRPKGVRGWGGAHTRFGRWHGGYAGDLYADGGDPGVYSAEYVRAAEEFPALVLLVETSEGIERIEEIVSVPGIDAVMFGWGDFAVESGFDQDACTAAALAVHAAAERNGVGVALSRGDRYYRGCFALAGVDSLLMSAALKAAVAEQRASFEAST